MFIIFGPGRLIAGAVLWGAIGALLVHIGLYRHHGHDPLWFPLVAGTLMCGFSALSVLTLAIYILRGVWIFFTAPWRRQ
jgi:hypothetical protein